MLWLTLWAISAFGDPEGVEIDVGGTNRILFYITTHASRAHLDLWKHNWTTFPNADMYMYLTSSEVTRDWLDTRPLIGWKNTVNPGYQAGAIQAMHDPTVLDDVDVDAYDWIIRLNPDVIIDNFDALKKILSVARTAHVLSSPCYPDIKPWQLWRWNEPAKKVMTDFTVMRPHVFAHVLNTQPRSGNAEIDMTLCVSTMGPVAWLPDSPEDGGCRTRVPGLVHHEF